MSGFRAFGYGTQAATTLKAAIYLGYVMSHIVLNRRIVVRATDENPHNGHGSLRSNGLYTVQNQATRTYVFVRRGPGTLIKT